MNGNGVARIIEAATLAAIPKPQVLEGPGYKRLARAQDTITEGVFTRRWEVEELPYAPVGPPPLIVHTLTGLVDYIARNRDGLDYAGIMVHVVDPATVTLAMSLATPISDVEEIPVRHLVVVARFEDLMRGNAGTIQNSGALFGFGLWMDPATFNVGLQALFVDTPERKAVLEVCGDVRAQGVTQYEDDGVTQAVVASAGVKLGRRVPVPNPVQLAPFRTFRELEQPESKFVLRMRGEPDIVPQIALFEADGGLWRLMAIERIAAFLRERLPEEVVVIA